jgi:glycolate oxidase iron-sulfur subunit
MTHDTGTPDSSPQQAADSASVGETGSIIDLGKPTPGGAFDEHHPPDAALIGDCVHCGFCLPTCPTYVLWGEEMDSPRGRIYLMKEGLEGEPMSDSMVSHWDACLGCMACVTSCPSGVQYDTLIEQTRAQVERRHDRSAKDKALRGLVFSLFPYPKRLKVARGPLRAMQKTGLDRALRRTGLLDKFAPQLAAMERLAPRLGKPLRLPTRIPASGTRRAVVGLLTGCVQGAFFPGVNAATARVLQAEGCDVVVPKSQGCCGALSVHNGREPEGQAFARSLIDSFEQSGVEYVVVNAAGCGSTMKDYARLLADDPEYAERARSFAERVRDVAEILDALGTVAPRHPLELTVAYHDACHLGHAQGIRAEPRRLLEAIPGLELKEIAEAELCCGSAGIYNIVNPEPANELGDRKAANIVATGAQLLVTANPGCLMQVTSAIERSGHPMGMAHTVEVLDASIHGAPASKLLPA